MKLFSCSNCSNVVHFENRSCESCGHRLGYLPATNDMHAVEDADGVWHGLKDGGQDFRFCENAARDACNWLIPAGSEEGFCDACRHNRTIPDLSLPDNFQGWRKMEFAKHHLFYSLLRLRLPLETRLAQPGFGLTFDFLVDGAQGPGSVVMTGHDEGIITLNLAEADDAKREKRRTEMNEPYRTLLGHFRHEIGHYYWDRLVRDGGRLDEFRACFGNESVDYNGALKTYYEQGPLPNWREQSVSAYSSAHPWEDFAETWAHYLHIIDTLEMAGSYGLQVHPTATSDASYDAEVDFDPHLAGTFTRIVNRWLPIAFAVNSINRCMGQPDLYPFVLTPAVIDKLSFIHDLIHGAQIHGTQIHGTQIRDAQIRDA